MIFNCKFTTCNFHGECISIHRFSFANYIILTFPQRQRQQNVTKFKQICLHLASFILLHQNLNIFRRTAASNQMVSSFFYQKLCNCLARKEFKRKTFCHFRIEIAIEWIFHVAFVWAVKVNDDGSSNANIAQLTTNQWSIRLDSFLIFQLTNFFSPLTAWYSSQKCLNATTRSCGMTRAD